ncbi:MAG: polysaccharide deacetylase family protein [Saprospiraceae bacterium]|nr:polysaccharide deacetylase family protein [Saprospiraceae bacterium]
MAGYRNAFLRFFRKPGALLPTPWLAAWSGQRFIVPVYHAVADENPEHIRHLYPVKTVREFTADLDFLLKTYQPIRLADLELLLNEGIFPKTNAFLLTFDDGLREFFDLIAPLLLQKGIPAICFLNSDFIDNRGLFFRYKASLLIGTFERKKEQASNPLVTQWLRQYAAGAKNIRSALLSVSYQHQGALDELAAVIDFDFSDYLTRQQPYLNSGQVASLQKQGFFFGAHSCDHPEYRFLSLEEQIRQTRESVADVCERFALPYRTFAFPFTDYGVSKAFFQNLYGQAPVLDLSFGCAGLKKDSFPRHIQRIPFETGDLSAKEILNNEYLYFLLKALAGKNRIRRT